VVGVVADVRWQGPASEGTTLYLPLAQHVGATLGEHPKPAITGRLKTGHFR